MPDKTHEDTAPANALALTVTTQAFPRYDPAHGTPDPMLRRVLTITSTSGEARFEQTDYGHAGRFNAWEPRGIDTKLQPRTAALLALCRAVEELL